MNKRVILLLGVLLIAGSAAFAAEGRKEIFKPVSFNNLNPPTGKYFLSRDIVGVGSTTPVFMGGNGVEEVVLDLNGFTIKAAPGGAPGLWVSNLRRFTVMNGTVIGNGIAFAAELSGGDNPDSRIVVENVNFIGSSVRINFVAAFAVRRSTFDQAGIGIEVDASSTLHTTGVIEECVFRDTTGRALYVNTAAGRLSPRGIRIIDNDFNQGWLEVSGGAEGVVVEGNTIVGSGAQPGAVYLKDVDGCQVLDNNLTNNGNEGIRLINSDHCFIKNNVVSGNGDEGIVLEGSSDNHIEGNVTNANTGFGIKIDSTSLRNRVRANSASSNTGGACTSACTFCNATCGANDFCDEAGAVTFGDNLFPGPGPC